MSTKPLGDREESIVNDGCCHYELVHPSSRFDAVVMRAGREHCTENTAEGELQFAAPARKLVTKSQIICEICTLLRGGNSSF